MGKLGLHTIQYPSGRWGFVGSVPYRLAFVKKTDGSTPTSKEIEDDLMLPGNYRKLKTKTWNTEKEASKEAKTI